MASDLVRRECLEAKASSLCRSAGDGSQGAGIAARKHHGMVESAAMSSLPR
jgi:hypothetical protein